MAASLLFKRAARAPALLGGEWGGWCCVFDAQTGIVKPIPDKYCSETAIAWGQIPLGFEELHTESFSAIGYLDGSERMTTDVRIGGGPEPMRRRRVQVHPADGCGGDSLPGAVTRSLLVTPRSSGALELHANNATASAHVDAWAIDTRIDGHPSTWRIETILRGIGGRRAASTINAFPSLGERTRVSVLFDPSTGQLAAETAHPSTPHPTPLPIVEVWQERCWSEDEALEVMETSRAGPLHLDGVDKSRRVGMSCFADAKAPVATSASQPATREGAVTCLPSSPALGAAEGESWRLSLLGGVELRGGPGLLEVCLMSDLEDGRTDGGERAPALRRVWKSGESGALPTLEG